MADMLQIGSQAANTFKRALDVTGHNIANVNTDGYSRQRAELASNVPNVVGQQFLGGGSNVSTIERVQADYIQRQLYGGQSLVERYDAAYSLGKQIEGVVTGNDEGVRDFMQRAFDSVQEMASNPTSLPSRQMFLDELENLNSHVSNLTNVLGDIQTQTNEQIRDLTTEVNDRLEVVQKVNEQVERAYSTGTQAPNDLLDQRDQAILELSQYIDIQTYPQKNGQTDIFLSAGDLPLLASNKKVSLSAELGPYKDENRVELYMNISGNKTVISDRVQGGQLGGVLDVRTEMLDKAQNDLGLTLNGMTAAMNWQHYQGYDLNGDAGDDLFTPLETSAINNVNNSGTESGDSFKVRFNPNYDGVTQGSEPPYVATGVAEQPANYGDKQNLFNTANTAIGQFVSREYEIRFDGADYQFRDNKTGELLTPTEQPAGSNRFQLDGLEFDLSAPTGTVQAGDEFLVKPHQAMLENFDVKLTDPDKIASRGQSPVATVANPSVNIGDPLSDASAPEPAAYGDNTNVANLASLQSKSILLNDSNDEATSTLLGGYSIMSSNVGTYLRGTEIQLTAQENVFQQLVERRDSLSGVSLDEEAANLLKYQQAYEASAQIISTSQSLFQTLLGVVRG